MRGNLFRRRVDLVVLTVRDAELCALLVRRDSPPFAGRWGWAVSSSRTKTCSTPRRAASGRRPACSSAVTTSSSSRATPHRTATRAAGC